MEAVNEFVARLLGGCVYNTQHKVVDKASEVDCSGGRVILVHFLEHRVKYHSGQVSAGPASCNNAGAWEDGLAEPFVFPQESGREMYL